MKVHMEEFGDVSKSTIVCFHGLGGSGRYTYSEIIPKLERDFHLLVFDSPGHGQTPAFESETDYLFSHLSSWYQTILKDVKGSFYLLGHSWGADLALHYAKDFPEKVLGVILLDGAFTFPSFQSDLTLERALSMWDQYIDETASPNWERVLEEYKGYTHRWDASKEGYVRQIYQEEEGVYRLIASKHTALAIVKAFFQEPFTEVYPLIKVPVLLVSASLPVEVEDARRKAICFIQSVADADIVHIEGAGHMLTWDEPEKISGLIGDWINSIHKKRGSL